MSIGWLRVGVDELAEILIFRQKYPMLTEGYVHDYAIVRTRRDFCHGKHVMADSPERSNHREVATLVGEEMHGLALSSFAGRSTNQHRFLVSHSVGGIANGSLDIGLGEPGIGIKQISLGGTLSEFSKNQFDRNTCATDDRFAHHHFGIHFNSMCRHVVSPLGETSIPD